MFSKNQGYSFVLYSDLKGSLVENVSTTGSQWFSMIFNDWKICKNDFFVNFFSPWYKNRIDPTFWYRVPLVIWYGHKKRKSAKFCQSAFLMLNLNRDPQGIMKKYPKSMKINELVGAKRRPPKSSKSRFFFAKFGRSLKLDPPLAWGSKSGRGGLRVGSPLIVPHVNRCSGFHLISTKLTSGRFKAS